jgi:predicted molibdopterin-dependent oxidoreductase YjgC
MAETLQLFIDGRQTDVPEGTTVAVAIMISGKNAFRRSVAGELRGPLCGMGICFECRATIDGRSQRRTCQTLCVEGMEVVTDGV